MIAFNCPTCKTKLLRNDTEAGSKIHCSSCNQKLLIPTPPRLSAKTLLGELELAHDNHTLLGDLTPVDAQTSDRDRDELEAQFSAPRHSQPRNRDRQPSTVQNPENSSPANLSIRKATATCTNCDAELEVPERLLGSTIPCPSCGQLTHVSRTLPETQSQRRPPWSYVVMACGLFGILLVAGTVLWRLVPFSSELGDEFAYLPDDCQIIASVNVQQVLDSESYKDMKKTNPAFEQGLRDYKGIALTRIKRITTGVNFSGESTLVFKLKSPLSPADIRSTTKISAYQTNFRYEEIRVGRFLIYVEVYDNDYRQGYEQNRPAFSMPDEKTVLRGTTIELRKILERSRKTSLSEPMKEALKDADFSRSMTIAMDLRAARSQPDFDFLKDGLRSYAGIHDLLTNADSLAVEANLGQTIKIDAILTCKDSRVAADGAKVLDMTAIALRNKILAERSIPAGVADVVGDMKFSTKGQKIIAASTCRPLVIVQAFNEFLDVKPR